MMAPMSKLRMLAGGIVEPGVGLIGSVSAYVAFRGRLGRSRLFKVQGPTNQPRITELDSATTVDLGRFRREVLEDLRPAVDDITARGGTAAIAEPKADWVADVVRHHLRKAEGAEVD
jgi:hypothetical protein